jgi:flagellar hook-length control protein FliK
MNPNVPIINLPIKSSETMSYNRDIPSTTTDKGQFKALLGQVSGIQQKGYGTGKSIFTDVASEFKSVAEAVPKGQASNSIDVLVLLEKLNLYGLGNTEGSVEALPNDTGTVESIQKRLKEFVLRVIKDRTSCGLTGNPNLTGNENIKIQPADSSLQTYTNVMSKDDVNTLTFENSDIKKLIEEVEDETITVEELVTLISRLNFFNSSTQGLQRTTSQEQITAELNNVLQQFNSLVPKGLENAALTNNLETPKQKIIEVLREYVTGQNDSNNSITGEDNFLSSEVSKELQNLLNNDSSTDNTKLLSVMQKMIANEEVPQEIKSLLKQYEIISQYGFEEVQLTEDSNINLSLPEEDKSFMIHQIMKTGNIEADINNVNEGLIVGKDEKNEVDYLKTKFIESEDKPQIKTHKFYSLLSNSISGEKTITEAQTVVEEKAVKKEWMANNHLEYPNKTIAVNISALDGHSLLKEAIQSENKLIKPDKSLSFTKNFEETTSKKEEKFLEGLIDNKTEAKDDKINILINHTKSLDVKTEDITVKERMSINKSTFVSDIIKSVKFMERSSLKELRVSIAPKELGEIIITVTIEAGKMKTSIAASNKEAYNLLVANAEEIRGSFNNNEIRIQDFSTNIYNGDTTFFKDGSQRQRNEGQGNRSPGKVLGNGEDAGDLTLENDSIIESQINILA